MEDRERRACRSIEGFGRDGWEDTVRELTSPEVIYEEIGTGRRLEGIEPVLDGMRVWKAAFPDITGEVLRLVSGGDSTALEILWRGTHTGPLATPLAGAIPPTGREVTTHATMWQRWEGERIVHERHHLDVLALMAQLGVLPIGASA
ncbi:MAG: ester cyclase [Pseudonocardia sp.]|nr:ester cyclase [Pseudonocardia sp.]